MATHRRSRYPTHTRSRRCFRSRWPRGHLAQCAARRYRRYGRVCCCCRRLVSRCLRFYNLRFIGRGKKLVVSIAFAVGRQTHAALATAEFCVRTTPSSLGLQARPACSANVQSVHQFHATPAICMRRAAPLSSLRASQAQSRDARRETRTLRKRRVKSSCFVWKDLSKRLAQHIMLSRTPEASSRNR